MEEPAPNNKKIKKNTVRKVVRNLTYQLDQILAQLKDVQTPIQLEKALTALKSVQALDTTNLTDPAECITKLEVTAKTCAAADDAAQRLSVVSKPIQTKDSDSCSFVRNFATWPVVSEKIATKRRQALSIEIEDGDSVLPPVRKFSELQILPSWLVQALDENKWSKPTSIQAQALPVLMSGQNLVGVAQTGSGKTGAFLLPAIVHIDTQACLTPRSPGPIVLILAPTRELAVQINEEAEKLLKYSCQSEKHSNGIRAACFYGGGRKQDQLRYFTTSGSHILVATPGRLADCVSAKDVSMSRVTYLVLDEADRMLAEGFSGEVEQILCDVRPDRQVALFSATWPASVQELAKTVMPKNASSSYGPVRIRVGAAVQASEEGALQAREGITQEVVVIDYPSSDWQKAEEEKSRLMEKHVRNVLTTVPDSKVLVFVNTKVQADSLSTKLWKEGFQADSMHGGRPQETRLSVLRRFREGELRLLVVTDVFARGLDIPQVSHVVIYEMGETEDYIHRIGRTGRGVGGTGHALVFFEYWPGHPGGAEELCGVLERSKQKVPDGLRAIATEVRNGKRHTKYSIIRFSF